ncbi:MAG: OsmC family protein [Bacteroidia bacterium]|nr:OsmC family protein [Bacteroidia bacterium]
MKRHATAHWEGSGKEGKGTLSSQSTVLNNTQYSFSSRFEEGVGTNPEELIAAALAGCFTMKLSFVLGAKSFTPNTLDTRADLTFENGAVTGIHLKLAASVAGISNDDFQAAALEAKENCPIGKLLNTSITLEAILV